jgi:tetrahydromethanopterin S-methyltransferase subunit A
VALVGNIRTFLRRHVTGAGKTEHWPFVSGRYRIVDATAPVVIVGSNAEALAEDLAALETSGICMIATHCRSPKDVEKLIRNIATNMAIQNVIVTDPSDAGSPALLALLKLLGADLEIDDAAQAHVRKIKSNLDDVGFDALARQVRAVNMLGSYQTDRIVARVSELASEANRPNTGFRAPAHDDENGIERVIAAKNIDYELQADKAGNFFVSVKDKKIVVEQYSAKNDLLRVIEGHTARDLCITLIRNGWVSKLDHAAWLGRELLRAELSMESGDEFMPDRTVALRLDELDEDELIRH